MFADNAHGFQLVVLKRACQKFVRRAALNIEFAQSVLWEMLEIVGHDVLRIRADRCRNHMSVVTIGKNDRINEPLIPVDLPPETSLTLM